MEEDNKQITPEETAVATVEAPAEASAPTRRKKVKRSVPHAQIHIFASFNNTIVSVSDTKGNVLTSSSAGASGFRGSKKGTAYAAQIAAEKAISDANQAYGITKADVYVKGVGLGRESAIRSLINLKVQVESLKDVTGIAHGGVRPRKPKRN